MNKISEKTRLAVFELVSEVLQICRRCGAFQSDGEYLLAAVFVHSAVFGKHRDPEIVRLLEELDRGGWSN